MTRSPLFAGMLAFSLHTPLRGPPRIDFEDPAATAGTLLASALLSRGLLRDYQREIPTSRKGLRQSPGLRSSVPEEAVHREG
jgi:hypothetical protein